ncbi:MAG: hypothetical protein IJ634_04135 [Bacteroidales bacterium]|nr:hypothetical protein [Bacteroidales bacterium]
MIRYCKLIFCVLLTCFSMSGKCYADELIRHNQDRGAVEGSIIRQYGTNCDVVCERAPNNNSFSMYEEGNAYANGIFIGDMYEITDFEIFDDVVYFCGKMVFGDSNVARIGYFDLTGFMNADYVQVEYLDIPWMKEVRALEVGNFARRKHVVIVGKGLSNEPYIADLMKSGSYWNINTTELLNDSLALHDLAITDSYVVVTSTKGGLIMREGLLWYFPKPTVGNASLLQVGTTQYYNIGSNVSEEYYVRSSSNDQFATVYTPGVFLGGTKNYCIMKYGGLGFSQLHVLTENNVMFSKLRDFVFETDNPYVPCVHLLINTRYTYGSFRSLVYELPIGGISSSVNVSSHTYNDVYITSIREKSDAQHFVMSGYGYLNGTPSIFKYEKGLFGVGCMSTVNNVMYKNSVSQQLKHYNYDRAVSYVEPYIKSYGVKIMRVVVDCNVQSKDSTEMIKK